MDLFAGIGGFHHALASLGGRCVLAVEKDEKCRRVYRTAFPDLPASRFRGDIRSITCDTAGRPRSEVLIARVVPDHEILCAGFPCQPFSKSGDQLGLRDQTRGTLFFDIMQIVEAKRPKLVLLENVRNLVGPRHLSTWEAIVASLRSAGYAIADAPVVLSPHALPPEQGGAPQVRDRVFILACRRDLPGAERVAAGPLLGRRPFPDWRPDLWDISQHVMLDQEIPDVEAYRLRPHELAWIDAWEAFVRDLPTDELPGFPIWAFAFVESPRLTPFIPAWKADFLERNSALYVRHRRFLDRWLRAAWGPQKLRVADFPVSRQKLEWQARQRHPARRGRTLRDLVLQLRPSGIRVRPPTYLPALVAISQTSVIGPDVAPGVDAYRRLTPAEASRLQGVPYAPFAKAGIADKDAYRQLGNAVCVGAARLAARSLIEASGWRAGS